MMKVRALTGIIGHRRWWLEEEGLVEVVVDVVNSQFSHLHQQLLRRRSAETVCR